MNSIWFKQDLTIEALQNMGEGNMGAYIGLVFTELGAQHLKASMPVDHRTIQPYGLLHGGASCVLAETLGSVASSLVVNPDKWICVGIEINANHVRSARAGIVTGTCTPIHLGASTHVWDIRIEDEQQKLVCISRLTVAVLKRRIQESL